MTPHFRPPYSSRRRSSASLFLVLGGGFAYAANTVFSSDIVDGQVKTADLDGGAVTSEKVADQTLLGRDVFDNTLKGADIDESTLSNVGGGGAAGGDLTGSYPNPEIAFGAVGSADVAGFSLGALDIQENSLGGFPPQRVDSRPVGRTRLVCSECDPGSSAFIVCDDLTFTLGRPMEVSARGGSATKRARRSRRGTLRSRASAATRLPGDPATR